MEIKIGDICIPNTETEYYLKKCRLNNLQADMKYLCYGIYDKEVQLLPMGIEKQRRYVFTTRKKGVLYKVSCCSLIHAPYVLVKPIGIRLSNHDMRIIRDEHNQWKNYVAERHYNKAKALNDKKDKLPENKQYIQIVSGGSVTPR